MKIRQNLHIHSKHSCDSACASLDDIQKEMTAAGITEFGISDHLHTSYNLCDLQGARNEFLCYDRPKNFHFGVEVSGVSQWEIDKITSGNYTRFFDDPVYGIRFEKGPADSPVRIGITAEDKKNLGIEYVIGGVHWPLYSEATREGAYEDYFRQMMALIENPLVDILAHPWDSIELAAGNWYPMENRNNDHKDWDAILNIPQEYNDKLIEALLKHNKCAELNLSILVGGAPEKCKRHYWNMLSEWREAGVKFTIGTDQHTAHHNGVIITASELLLDCYGFKDDDIRYLFE